MSEYIVPPPWKLGTLCEVDDGVKVGLCAECDEEIYLLPRDMYPDPRQYLWRHTATELPECQELPDDREPWFDTVEEQEGR